MSGVSLIHGLQYFGCKGKFENHLGQGITGQFCLKAAKDLEPSIRSQNPMPNRILRTRQMSAKSKRTEEANWYQSGLILEVAENPRMECFSTLGSLFTWVVE